MDNRGGAYREQINTCYTLRTNRIPVRLHGERDRPRGATLDGRYFDLRR